jgi:hypothetical protein
MGPVWRRWQELLAGGWESHAHSLPGIPVHRRNAVRWAAKLFQISGERAAAKKTVLMGHNMGSAIDAVAP